VGFESRIRYEFPMEFRLGIEYRGNSLIMSGTGIPVRSPFFVRFGSGEKSSPETGMGKISLDPGGSHFPLLYLHVSEMHLELRPRSVLKPRTNWFGSLGQAQ
jgi:hypothetical protein